MAMTPEISNDSFNLSPPMSPSRGSVESLRFYSVPTSPTRKTLQAKYGHETEPTTPKTYQDANSNLDDFEFETSSRFNMDFETSQRLVSTWNHQKQQQQMQQQGQHRESLPAMAFADELFCDGKVMPLKLPPRLQYDNKFSNQSSTASPPRSPNSAFKLSFMRQSLWNDEFDPFMVALENVKEENRGKTQGNNHRRARSMSPIRAISPQRSNDSAGWKNRRNPQVGPFTPKQEEPGANWNMWMEPTSPAYSICDPNQNRQVGHQSPMKQGQKSPIRLAEPKGVLYARRARLVKIDQEKPSKTTKTTFPEPTVLSGENGKESGGSCTRKSKRQKIKKFLLKSVSMRKSSDEDKQKYQNEASSKLNLSGRFSSKSMGLTQYNEEEKRVSEVTKMTLTQYRPKLLLCMGYGGARYVR